MILAAFLADSAKPLHQVKGFAVGLNGKNTRPAMDSSAPTSGISGTPLLKGCGFLNHLPTLCPHRRLG